MASPVGRARKMSVPRVSVPGMGDGLVQARGLRKSFGAFEAVRGIDVDVAPGEVFGFLGPNGAGKSSTMRMIACVSPRSGGTLQVLGMDPDADGPRIRARIGVVPQQDNLDAELTVRENLEIYGRYFGLSAAQVRAKADGAAGVRAAHRPGGHAGRAAVRRHEAAADDRPLAGQRPRAAAARRADHRAGPAGPAPAVGPAVPAQTARASRRSLTTHYMDEAEQLCDRLVVMDGGVIVAEGSPARADHALLHPRGARAAVRAGRPDAGRGRSDGSPSGSRRCRTGCCSTPPTASDLQPRLPAARLRPMSALVRRSHAGGRVPAAHRPDAGGLMATATVRLARPHRTRADRRAACCWSSSGSGRGTGATGGPPPSRRSCSRCCSCSLSAWGSVRWSTARARRQATGGVGYLVWLAPALLCVSAVQTAIVDSTYPVLSGFKWQRFYLAMTATPISPGQVAAGHLALDRRSRSAARGRVYVGVIAAFGGVRSAGIVARAAGGDARRSRRRRAGHGVHRGRRGRGHGVQRSCSGSC